MLSSQTPFQQGPSAVLSHDQQGDYAPPGGSWQRLGTFWLSQRWGRGVVLLASSGLRKVMSLSVPECQGQSPHVMLCRRQHRLASQRSQKYTVVVRSDIDQA